MTVFSITDPAKDSLLHPDVYKNVERWDEDQKLCICPTINEGDHVSLCSVSEDDNCQSNNYYSYWTRINAKYRTKRSVDFDLKYAYSNVDGRLAKMRKRWESDVYHFEKVSLRQKIVMIC